jgi:hypothetical protein
MSRPIRTITITLFSDANPTRSWCLIPRADLFAGSAKAAAAPANSGKSIPAVLPGDSLLVVDSGTGRMTVLAPLPSASVVSGASLSGRFYSFVALKDGSVIANGVVPTSEYFGLPLFLIRRNGQITSGFGAEDPVFRPDIPYAAMRTVAGAGETRVWSAHKTQYAIEMWDASGRHLSTLVRAVPWFRPYVKRTPVSRDHPLDPWLTTVHQAHDGLLWTFSSVPVRDWAAVFDHLRIDPAKASLRIREHSIRWWKQSIPAQVW